MVASITPWDGNLLDDGIIALARRCESASSSESAVWMVGVINGPTLSIPSARIAEFFQLHSARALVCRDAAKIYWILEALIRTTAPRSVSQLQRGVRDGRFIDLDLWQRLLDLAIDGYGQRTTPNEVGDISVAQVLAKAIQFEEATRRLLNIPIRSSFPHQAEWLGLNYAVMSTIASTIEPAPTFPLPFARQRDALAKLEAYLTRVSQKIQQSKELRRCYEFSDGLIKLHDDRPQYDTHRLRSFLQGRWNGLREPHDYPIPAPARNGMFSIRSRDWGRLAYCDDQLTLWAEFETLCHLMKSVRNFSSEHVSAHNEVFPRIKSAIDGLSLLADPDLLQSVSEKALLWIRLPDLEARCLATVCRTRYGRAVMAEAAVSHKNLNRFTADELDLAGSGFMTGADRTSINSYIEKLAGCLLFSAGLRLSDHATMGLFRRVGATSISLDLMRSIRDRLVDRFPELDRIECETAASFFDGSLINRQTRNSDRSPTRSILHWITEALKRTASIASKNSPNAGAWGTKNGMSYWPSSIACTTSKGLLRIYWQRIVIPQRADCAVTAF